jgi:hypothetical protein
MSTTTDPNVTALRFFAVFEGGEWCVGTTPDLAHDVIYGPFASREIAWAEINSPYWRDEMPQYEPTAEEYAARRLKRDTALAAMSPSIAQLVAALVS